MNTPDLKALAEGIKQSINPSRFTEISARLNSASDGKLITVEIGRYGGICNWELRQIETKVLKRLRGEDAPYIGISADDDCLTLTIKVVNLKKEYIHDCPEQN